MGYILLTWKAEPAIDGSDIEARLQGISKSPQCSSSELSLSDVPIGPSATLANASSASMDGPASNDFFTDLDVAMTDERDPLEMLALRAASNRTS